MTAVVVWRICYNADLSLAGLPFGSTQGSGRWHLMPPLGLPVVYASSTRALAQLEKRVHANGVAPVNQAVVRLELPAAAVLQDATLDLALDWTRWRTDEGYTQALGVRWVRSQAALGLWVPSIIEEREMNLVLNPAHPQYPLIKVITEIEDFRFDPRLF